MPVNPTGFDYIAVGAGAAGCVMANRLSSDPAVRVALVEARPSDRRFPVNLKTTLPVGNVVLLPHARYNWQHVYSGGDAVNGRDIPCPRGKLFCGCTSVNGTVYMRGRHSDYDEWAALGNAGWGFDDVLPYFRQHENRAGSAASPGSAFHGAGGELDVERPAHSNPLAHAFVDAAAQAGHPRNDDFNGRAHDGFGIFESNQRRGVRLSSSRAFLHPALARPNLTVFADTLVGRINLSCSRATGDNPRTLPRKHGFVKLLQCNNLSFLTDLDCRPGLRDARTGAKWPSLKKWNPAPLKTG